MSGHRRPGQTFDNRAQEIVVGRELAAFGTTALEGAKGQITRFEARALGFGAFATAVFAMALGTDLVEGLLAELEVLGGGHCDEGLGGEDQIRE